MSHLIKENDFGEEGAFYLSKAIKRHSKLITLLLEWNPKLKLMYLGEGKLQDQSLP
jgi:hypothetical protein